MIKDEIEVVISERKKKHIEDDAGIQICWNKLVQILSEDEEKTVIYLQNCTSEDLYWISEVFEDISEELQSNKYIDCLRELDKKYPLLEMTTDIDLAEEYIE